MKKVREFFNRIVQSDTKESSKRLISLMMMIPLMYCLFKFCNYENVESILNSIYLFISTLLGIGAWEKIKR